MQGGPGIEESDPAQSSAYLITVDWALESRVTSKATISYCSFLPCFTLTFYGTQCSDPFISVNSLCPKVLGEIPIAYVVV